MSERNTLKYFLNHVMSTGGTRWLLDTGQIKCHLTVSISVISKTFYISRWIRKNGFNCLMFSGVTVSPSYPQFSCALRQERRSMLYWFTITLHNKLFSTLLAPSNLGSSWVRPTLPKIIRMNLLFIMPVNRTRITGVPEISPIETTVLTWAWG